MIGQFLHSTNRNNKLLQTRNYIRKIVTSELTRNSAKLLSANVVAQAIGLLVYPILTRLYSPEDFGLLNLFLSIGGVLALLSTAEYQYAIVLPKTQNKAVACFHVGFFMLLAITALCAASIPFKTQIATLFNAPALTKYYPLLCVFVFVTGLWTLLNYWFTRNKQFSRISTYQLTQSISGAGLKYSFGVGGMVNGGLVWSIIVAPIIAIAASICRHFRRNIRPLCQYNKHDCRVAAKEYVNFPKYSLPRALINNLSGNLPILLLTPFFGLTEIGYFGMAFTLAFRPINMISGSLYQVLFQRISEQVQNRQSILPFFRKFVKSTLFIVIPSFAVLSFVLPWLTRWLLGPGWEVTGEYIRWMLPWLCCSLLTASVCFLSDVFAKQRIGLWFEILLAVLRTIGVLAGVLTNSFNVAVVGYAISSAIAILAQFVWLYALVKKYDSHIN